MDIEKKVRHVQDFPIKGIGFKDITPLIADSNALRETITQMKLLFKDVKIDLVVGIESRGFIFAAILAFEWGVGMIPVRKPGKLPFKTLTQTYQLEYGQGELQIHADAIEQGQNVLIVDDLLATGGTVQATASLIEQLGGNVIGCCFLIELDFLRGREKLQKYRIESLIHYISE